METVMGGNMIVGATCPECKTPLAGTIALESRGAYFAQSFRFDSRFEVTGVKIEKLERQRDLFRRVKLELKPAIQKGISVCDLTYILVSQHAFSEELAHVFIDEVKAEAGLAVIDGILTYS
jgi:hypothetical protein